MIVALPVLRFFCGNEMDADSSPGSGNQIVSPNPLGRLNADFFDVVLYGAAITKAKSSFLPLPHGVVTEVAESIQKDQWKVSEFPLQTALCAFPRKVEFECCSTSTIDSSEKHFVADPERPAGFFGMDRNSIGDDVLINVKPNCPSADLGQRNENAIT
ncbi:hypothetical protein [Rhizobium leguminosarum]|uniref:hypothetical protein n=1 Tax=Rhizobium leguminosarum TaxID=384 RepID=UPI002F91DE7C